MINWNGEGEPFDPDSNAWTDQTMAVVADLFPCLIRDAANPATVLRGKAKVVITSTAVFVLVDRPTTPFVSLLYFGEVTSLSGSAGEPTGFLVTTPDGAFRVTGDVGCACGTRLKGVRAFNRLVSTPRS